MTQPQSYAPGVVLITGAGLRHRSGIAAYRTSKAACLQLARVAAKEGAPRGVRVNTLLPGEVETPIWRSMPFFADLVAETGFEQAAFARRAGFATPVGHRPADGRAGARPSGAGA